MPDKINRLSELAGILPDYYDIWGGRHETTEATQRRLLEAMGLIGGVDLDIEAAIRDMEAAVWKEILPPVMIAWPEEPAAVTCRLSKTDAGHVHSWRIRLESGGELVGEFRPIDLDCLDAHGEYNRELLAVQLHLPALSELGYHRLEIGTGQEELASCSLIVCPHTAYTPPLFNNGDRVWGLAVQLYALRSRDNWGMGDYADLPRALDWAATAGADLIGLSPLHALFLHNPSHCSPYSPSSRQFFNMLFIGIEAIPEFAECDEARNLVADPVFSARLEDLRSEEFVDYQGVTEAKLAVLEPLYRHFRARHLAEDSARARVFLDFCREGGKELHLFALYQALQAHFYARDHKSWGWLAWPEDYRRPENPKVRAFAVKHAYEVEWHLWLQWLAEEQLAVARRHAEAHGLGIGLYQDLAVGVDKSGAETWMHRDLYALQCRIGCPPDDFNLLGQDWGLPPWLPWKLRDAAYQPYIAMLQANMKYAGALRIDHVMGLMRLYWIPPASKGDAGAYLAYPFGDLLAILALESHRNRCLVIGEDLGTVPDEVRHALHEMGALTYRLFYFERQHDGRFAPPAWYPHQALVAASTHDLPTLAGYWKGRDIDIRTELELFPNEEIRDRQIAGRIEDRWRLLAALAEEGLLPEGISLDPDEVPEWTPALAHAVFRYLARSPARITLIQAEDMLGQTEQANMPGTVNGYPNWRRKLPSSLEDWYADEDCRAAVESMNQERGRNS